MKFYSVGAELFMRRAKWTAWRTDGWTGWRS